MNGHTRYSLTQYQRIYLPDLEAISSHIPPSHLCPISPLKQEMDLGSPDQVWREKRNFPMTLSVRLMVGWSDGRSVCHNSLTVREVSLPCSYRSTRSNQGLFADYPCILKEWKLQ